MNGINVFLGEETKKETGFKYAVQLACLPGMGDRISHLLSNFGWLEATHTPIDEQISKAYIMGTENEMSKEPTAVERGTGQIGNTQMGIERSCS